MTTLGGPQGRLMRARVIREIGAVTIAANLDIYREIVRHPRREVAEEEEEEAVAIGLATIAMAMVTLLASAQSQGNNKTEETPHLVTQGFVITVTNRVIFLAIALFLEEIAMAPLWILTLGNVTIAASPATCPATAQRPAIVPAVEAVAVVGAVTIAERAVTWPEIALDSPRAHAKKVALPMTDTCGVRSDMISTTTTTSIITTSYYIDTFLRPDGFA